MKRTCPCEFLAKRAFTLIELLVVIAIIALLVSLLLPSLQKAKSLAKEVLCTTNLKAIGNATYIYQGDYDGRLPNAWAQQLNNMVHRNWKVLLAPYCGDLEVDPISANGQLEHGINNCPEQTSVISGSYSGDMGFYGGYGWSYALGYDISDPYTYISVVSLKYTDVAWPSTHPIVVLSLCLRPVCHSG